MGRDREESRRRGGEDDEAPRRRSREDDDEPRRSRSSRDEDEDDGDRKSSKRSGKFEYAGRSSEDLKRRANQSGGNYDRPIKSKFGSWRPQEGENTIRILPATWREKDGKKPGHYGLDIYIHRNVGVDSQTYLCLKEMKGEDCPICKMRMALEKDGQLKAAKKLKAAKQVAMWIIDRDDESAGPQVYTMPFTLDKEIAGLSVSKKKGIIQVDHPEEGRDITFKREGTDVQTDYNRIVIDSDDTPISEDQDKMDEWLEFICDNPIPEVLNYYEPDYLEGVCAGTVSKDDDDDLDEDDGRSRRRGRGRGEDDDEDERPRRKGRGRDEEEDDEPRRRSRDEEEDANPPRRRSSRDEDEEDDKPRRRRREETSDDDDEIPSERRHGKAGRDDDDDEKPRRHRDDDEEEKPRGGGTKRRSLKDEDGEDDADDGEVTAVRERLTERMKKRNG